MNTKKCKYCGKENFSDMKFCSECGKKFEDDKENDEKIFCPECGARNDIDNQYCEECGACLIEEPKYLEEEKAVANAANSITFEEENNVEEKSEEEKVFCPECGTKNDIDNQYCEECDASLIEEPKDLEEEKAVDDLVNFITLECENKLEEVDEEKNNTENNSLSFEESYHNDEKGLENVDKPLEVSKEERKENAINDEKVKDVNKLEKFNYEVTEKNDEEKENLEEPSLIINADKQDIVPTEAKIEEPSLAIDENISNDNIKKENLKQEVNKKEKDIKEKKTKESKPKVKIKINPVIIGTLIAIVVAAVITTGIVINKDKIFWSAGTTELPTNINDGNSIIESKTQYSKRTKETTTSSEKELDGWTLDENNLPSDETKEEVVAENNIDSFEQNKQIQIIKKEVLEEKYAVVLCGLYNPSDGQNRFYLPNDNDPYCNQENSYTLKEVVVSDKIGSYKLGDSYKEKSYTNSDKEKIYYKIVQVINSKVKYTYKDNDSLYHFYRYSDWSKYSDEKYNSDEMTEVKEATVYRYKKK